MRAIAQHPRAPCRARAAIGRSSRPPPPPLQAAAAARVHSYYYVLILEAANSSHLWSLLVLQRPRP